MSLFEAYSRYYDLLYQDKDYESESDYIQRLIQQNVPGAKNILELGCGTGAHATILAKQGFNVLGIDSSESMLRQAEIKFDQQPDKVKSNLHFSFGDVRTYRAEKHFDAVLSLFHVLCYQINNEDVISTFETAAIHLRPGGLFLFDFWYGPAVLIQKPGARIKRLSDANTFVMRLSEPELKVNENRVDVRFEVIVEDIASGNRSVIIENHPVRYFFLPEIDLVCKKSGFENVHFEAWMGGEVNDQSWGVTCYAFRR
ncbi:MAG: class I SAM-dependent DNA methyltransferase [Desulfomonilaceae bacterium]